MKLLIELINGDKIDTVVKGDREKLIATIVLAMEEAPEVREAIMSSCQVFLDRNKFKIFN